LDEEKRIWSLRLNLDDFNSEYLKLRNDGDRFSFFLGFHCGCMNGDLAESDPKPFESGYGIGSAMHSKALALSQANAGSAKSSVDTRRLKYGTAQPPKRTPSERSSERSGNAQANAERSPERLSSLTIEPSNDVTKEPGTKKRAKVFVPPTIEEATAYAKSVGFAGIAQWFAYYETNGWKVGKNKMTDWKAAIRYWKSKDGAAFAAPTLDEWMQAGEQIAMSNPTHARQRWPRDLCRSAYHGAAANGWRGVADWRGKILSECLRWVGNENGRART